MKHIGEIVGEIMDGLDAWFDYEREEDVATEHDEQSLVVQWAEAMKGKYPELECLFAVPNAGRRGYQVARAMKREGLKSGVPDLVLPVGRGGYNALFVEMKRKKARMTKTKGIVYDETKPSEAQIDWHGRLARHNNLVVVATSAEAAEAAIQDYLEGKWRAA